MLPGLAPGQGLAGPAPAATTASRWRAGPPTRIPAGTCLPSTRRATRWKAGSRRPTSPRSIATGPLQGAVFFADGAGLPASGYAWSAPRQWQVGHRQARETLRPLLKAHPAKSRKKAKRLNITHPGRKAELGAKTRSKKDKEMTPGELSEARTDSFRRSAGGLGARWQGMSQSREVTAREAARRLPSIIVSRNTRSCPSANCCTAACSTAWGRSTNRSNARAGRARRVLGRDGRQADGNDRGDSGRGG